MAHADINTCFLINQKRNAWMIEVPRETTLKEIQQPEFWNHLASKFTTRDEVQVWWSGELRRANLTVVRVTKSAVHVALDNVTEYEASLNRASITDDIAKYEISYHGPAKFRIVRKVDNEAIHDGFDTEESAVRWLVSNVLGVPQAQTVTAPVATAQKKAA